MLCGEIGDNHPTEGTDPTIATCTDCGTNNSPAACIYSLLNAKTDYWYCADSTGVAGFTIIDPGGVGNCVGAASAKCSTLD